MTFNWYQIHRLRKFNYDRKINVICSTFHTCKLLTDAPDFNLQTAHNTVFRLKKVSFKEINFSFDFSAFSCCF